MFRKVALAALLLTATASAALAGEVTGDWARNDGKAKVKFSHCGSAICGVVTWLQDPSGPGKIGQKVFYDMIPSGDNAWAGKAFNPEDGKEYTGKMQLEGAGLTTSGCVFGGWICKSFTWTRAP